MRAAGGNAGERRASPQAVGSLGSIDSATGSAIVGGRRASAGATMGGRGSARAAPGSLLLGLEKKPLLKVFVFLNAGEVLRAAQVCRAMFKKVREFGGSYDLEYCKRSCLGSTGLDWTGLGLT